MKRLLLLFCLFNALNVFSQIFDDFEDGDLSSNPEWIGNLSDFTILNSQLKSNSSTPNSTFYLSTPCEMEQFMQWDVFIKLNFNPSSVNYIDYVLMSDSEDIRNFRNGIYIRCGGSQDDVSLHELIDGIDVKLIDGANGLLNKSSSSFRLRVLRVNDSIVLKYRPESEQEFNVLGNARCQFNLNDFSCGIRIRQSTSSFFGKHFIDDLYVGKMIKDTIPPKLDSLKYIHPGILLCYFNEKLSELNLNDVSRYSIVGSTIVPDSVDFDDMLIRLYFNEKLPVNEVFELRIDSISDQASNVAIGLLERFFTLKYEKAILFDLIMTELMVDPEPPIGLSNKEYVEIKNTSNKYIDLSDCSLRDQSSSRKLPNKVLYPDSFIVVYEVPSLNNSGELIELVRDDSILIHRLKYDLSWYGDPSKSNGGYSLEMIDPSKPCLIKSNWSASKHADGGTPGKTNSINALLVPDTLAPSIKNILVLPNGHLKLVLTEDFDSIRNPNLEMKFNSRAIQARIIEQNYLDGNLTIEISEQISLDSIYELVFAGFADCSGNVSSEQSFHWQWPSLPIRNQLIFNEILFNPRSDGSDYIELLNISKYCFDLSNLYIADLKGGLINFMYRITSEQRFVYPGDFVLLTEDTSVVCEQYRCLGKAIKILVPKLPSMPDDEGDIVLVNLRSDYVDSLSYSSDWHFPLLDDQNGVSLERLNRFDFNHNANNWHSASWQSGFGTPGYENSQVIVKPLDEGYFTASNTIISPNSDAHNDIVAVFYKFPFPDIQCTANIFDISGRQVSQILNNVTLSSEGSIVWDGLDDDGNVPPTGVYILAIDCYHYSGKRFRKFYTLVLN